MTQLYNKQKVLNQRRYLRSHMTEPEILVWSRLKNKQLYDVKFRRQYSVGNYILDFYAPQYKVGVEIDGSGHFSYDKKLSDQKRSEFLNNLGIKVLRYTNIEVASDLDSVLNDIWNNIRENEGSTSP